MRYPVEKSPYRKFRERPHEIGGCRLNARVVVRLWQAAGSRKSPVAKAAVDVATVTPDSGNLRISRVGHPRYSRRHPLSALQETKQRTDASYISGSYPKGVTH